MGRSCVVGYWLHIVQMVLLWLFVSGPVHAKPINLKGIKFIMRFPQDSMEVRPHDSREVKVGDAVLNMDNPTPTISSLDHHWYELIEM
jgi:hypothetical protein